MNLPQTVSNPNTWVSEQTKGQQQALFSRGRWAESHLLIDLKWKVSKKSGTKIEGPFYSFSGGGRNVLSWEIREPIGGFE